MDLTETSSRLLHMLDKIDDESYNGNGRRSNVSKLSNSEFSFDQSYSPRKFKQKSQKMREFLLNNKVPQNIMNEIVENQENFAKWSHSVIRPEKQANSINTTEEIPSSCNSARSYSSNSSKKSNFKFDDDSAQDNRIKELELKVKRLERRLSEEIEIRENLTDSLKNVITTLSEKCLAIKSSTLSNIDTMFERLKLANPRASTSRLLSQEINTMISDMNTDEKIPSPSLRVYSPSKSKDEISRIEILTRGCNELAKSLMKGFYNEKIVDFGRLSFNPIEFARQVSQIKKSHDIGLADIKSKYEACKQMCDQIEELENKKAVTEQTAKLVQNLMNTMSQFTVQSREEFEDLIDNM